MFHYNLPKSLEGYTQEIGRAGRDGQPAICDLLACAEDQTVLENFIFSDIPSERAVRNLLERVLRLGEAFDVSIYELATTCDIRQTVIETLFTYLEMDGVLEVGGKSFDTYRVKLLRPLKSLLLGRKPKERKHLEHIFSTLDAEWKWLSIKIPDVAPELGISSDKLRELISELETGGDIALKNPGGGRYYRLKNGCRSEIDFRRDGGETSRTRNPRALSARPSFSSREWKTMPHPGSAHPFRRENG